MNVSYIQKTVNIQYTKLRIKNHSYNFFNSPNALAMAMLSKMATNGRTKASKPNTVNICSKPTVSLFIFVENGGGPKSGSPPFIVPKIYES